MNLNLGDVEPSPATPSHSGQIAEENGLLSSTELEEHMKIVKSKARALVCRLCSVKSNCVAQYVKHYRQMHPLNKPYHCHICEYECQKKQTLMEHVMSHAAPRFNCDQCEKVYHTKKILKAHYDTVHLCSKLFKCHLCSYETKKNVLLDLHYNNAHASGKDPAIYHTGNIIGASNRSEGRKKGKEYVCKLCGNIYNNKYVLKRHIDVVHVRKVLYVCTICPKTFRTKKDLTAHVNSVHLKVRAFKCTYCPFSTSIERNLKFHINSLHLQIRPFVCSQCSKSFVLKNHLKQHVRSVHEKGKRIECKDCRYIAIDEKHMQKHVQNGHLEQEDHECFQCQLKFRFISNLVKHVNAVHLKLKPFKCPECDYACSVRVNLKIHVRRKHKKELDVNYMPYISQKDLLLKSLEELRTLAGNSETS